MLSRVLSSRRRVVVTAAFALVATLVVTGVLSARASANLTTCQRFAATSHERAERVTGTGERVVVIGDSWSVGLGLDRPLQSWPGALPGRVRVAGFSGSGFSAKASPCGRVSFADRATAALRGGADLVVVEGGLNDFDRTDAEITAGFDRLAEVVAGHDVVVVGPASAPSRARQVPRVDALLRELSAAHGFAYVSTEDMDLPYLPDRMNLTAKGHRVFGDAVAARIALLPSRSQ